MVAVNIFENVISASIQNDEDEFVLRGEFLDQMLLPLDIPLATVQFQLRPYDGLLGLSI